MPKDSFFACAKLVMGNCCIVTVAFLESLQFYTEKVQIREVVLDPCFSKVLGTVGHSSFKIFS